MTTTIKQLFNYVVHMLDIARLVLFSFYNLKALNLTCLPIVWIIALGFLYITISAAKKHRRFYKDQVFVAISSPFKYSFQRRDKETPEFSAFLEIFYDLISFSKFKPSLAIF